MMVEERNAVAFEDIKVHVRFKLFALGCSVRFFYIYGFRALSAWKIAGNCRWKSALRCYLSRSLAGDVGSHDNSESNAPAGPACKSESLGEYRVRRDIQGDHDSGDQRWLALLRSLRIDRNHLTVLMVWYAWTWPKQSTR